MENQLNSNTQKGGLYSKIKMSVKAANIMVTVLSITLVLAIFFVVSNRGFTVKFDTAGGTHLETQKAMYGDYLKIDQEPTREGYVFAGWYLDENCTNPWDIENDMITGSMTLYAKWVKK